jgi:signal peptidase II
MLYFPLFSFDWPEWIPGIGGNHFEFFRPVFNVADSAITLGLTFIFLFQRKFFRMAHMEEEKAEDIAEEVSEQVEGAVQTGA